MQIKIVAISKDNLEGALSVWNEVVIAGKAFPQLNTLNKDDGFNFFMSQSYTGVAINIDTGEVVGLYILHPNNIGRCGHICNASYAVNSKHRGLHIGELLVTHCINKAKELSFKILQFNAVVASNTPALSLYKKLGFTRLGTIPNGFLNKDNNYEDIIVHYLEL